MVYEKLTLATDWFGTWMTNMMCGIMCNTFHVDKTSVKSKLVFFQTVQHTNQELFIPIVYWVIDMHFIAFCEDVCPIHWLVPFQAIHLIQSIELVTCISLLWGNTSVQLIVWSQSKRYIFIQFGCTVKLVGFKWNRFWFEWTHGLFVSCPTLGQHLAVVSGL